VAAWVGASDAEEDDRESSARCLACGAVLEPGLIGGGSLRCLDCRAANTPLDPTLVAAWRATGGRR